MICVRMMPLASCLVVAGLLTGCGQAGVYGNASTISNVNRPTVTIASNQTSVTTGATAMLTWSTSEAASCTASGGWSGAIATSGTQSVTLTKTTTYTLSCVGGGITSAASVTIAVSGGGTVTTPPGTVARPSYNTGDGFFVLNGKLYDPDGIEFRIRGVNRTHYDSESEQGIVNSKANAVRMFATTYYGDSWQQMVNIMQGQHIANQQLAIPTFFLAASGVTSCDTGTAKISEAVSTWVSNAKLWTPLNRYIMPNIANEWGPSNNTLWRDQYISAIKQLRAAGYLSPLLIDTGGCGQDIQDLANYATAVFNADPQKNIVFSFHLYGLTSSAQMPTYFAQMAALAQSAGMAFVIGEFGPGRNIGPSPTLITPGAVITTAETNNLGWMPWAWDDNDLGNCRSDNNWFSMTYNCGMYTQSSDLTDYGQDVVLNATYGLQALAQKPNW